MLDKIQNIDTQNSATNALLNAVKFAFFTLRVLIIILIVTFIFGGIFYVKEYQKAMLFRFGKLQGLKGEQLIDSGQWHWAWPDPVDKVIRVKAKRSLRISTAKFWFYEDQNKLTPQGPEGDDTAMQSSPLVPGKDGYLITADANIIHTKWSIVYKISDPVKYYVKAINPEKIIKNIFENAIITITGAWNVDQALYKDSNKYREEVEKEVFLKLQTIDIGVTAEHVYLEDRTPPRSTITAFRSVIEAEQQMHRKISESDAYVYQKKNTAKGKSSQVISDANVYKKRIISSTRSQAKYFESIFEKYKKYPETTLISLYHDTISEVMQNVDNKYFIHVPEPGQHQEIRIKINPDTKKNKDKK